MIDIVVTTLRVTNQNPTTPDANDYRLRYTTVIAVINEAESKAQSTSGHQMNGYSVLGNQSSQTTHKIDTQLAGNKQSPSSRPPPPKVPNRESEPGNDRPRTQPRQSRLGSQIESDHHNCLPPHPFISFHFILSILP